MKMSSDLIKTRKKSKNVLRLEQMPVNGINDDKDSYVLHDVLLRLSTTTFLKSTETRSSERAHSISIDVTIARGIATFFEETSFEKPGPLVGRVMNKIGSDLTCETRFTFLATRL